MTNTALFFFLVVQKDCPCPSDIDGFDLTSSRKCGWDEERLWYKIISYHKDITPEKMSGNCLKYFLPFTYELASSSAWVPQVLDFFFPDPPHIPTLHVKIWSSKTVHVEWPSVAACALAGIVVFADAGKRLFRLSRTKHRFRGSFSWSMAMWWYAFMCVGGFWFHSFDRRELFHKVDVVGTACSSASIVAGSVGFDDRNPTNRLILTASYLSVTVVVFFWASQLVWELLYLLPAAAAFVSCFRFYLNTVAAEFGGGRKTGGRNEKERKRKEKVGRWVLVAGFGGASILVGLVSSSWIAEMIGQNFGVAFWMFSGCHVALWGLFRMLVALNDVELLVFA